LNGYQAFVSEDGDFQSAFFLQLRGDSHQFSFTIPYNFFILSQSGFTPIVNHWYHLAGVYDAAAQSASLYVNGVLANAVYNVPPRPANGLTGIGRGWYNNSRVDFNHAAVDDVRFYNSALSAADVFKVALIGNPCSLVTYSGQRRCGVPGFGHYSACHRHRPDHQPQSYGQSGPARRRGQRRLLGYSRQAFYDIPRLFLGQGCPGLQWSAGTRYRE
jgi:hypothetical protein